MKRLIFVFSLLSFAGGKIYAQKAYTYVRQNGTKLEKLGTAAFDVAAQSYPRVQFVDGKAVMSIGDTRVAALPMADGGELVVSYTTDVAEADLNKVSKKPTEQKPFATIYSRFSWSCLQAARSMPPFSTQTRCCSILPTTGVWQRVASSLSRHPLSFMAPALWSLPSPPRIPPAV